MFIIKSLAKYNKIRQLRLQFMEGLHIAILKADFEEWVDRFIKDWDRL